MSAMAKGWIAWFAFTLVVILVAGPAIRQSVEESGVLELLSQSAHREEDREVRTVEVCFSSFDGTFSLYGQTQPKLGGSAYHDCFESLLAGPDEQAVAGGAVTYIASGTSLIGLSLSEGILFVDLSARFLESPDLQKASRQLELTAKGFDRVRDLVILVEGERFTLPAESRE